LSIGLQLDFFNLEAPHFILRAATVIGLGFKLILDTPKYKTPARNKMP
jgi:hypothetical protein